MSESPLLPSQIAGLVREFDAGLPLYHGTSGDFDERVEPLQVHRRALGAFVATHWDEADYYARHGRMTPVRERRTIEYASTKCLRLVCMLTGEEGEAFHWVTDNPRRLIEAGLDGYAYTGVDEKDPRNGTMEACHVVLFDPASSLRHVITRPAGEVPEQVAAASVPAP